MKKLKLLVVEDDPQSLYLLQFLLQERGHHVETAANGVEALEKARREPPDMAISDILMPQMDGFTLCREWKKDQQLKGIPFVFYTATYTDPKDEEFALSLGAERFITKPTEPEAFLEIVQDVIKEHEEGVLARPKEPVAEEAVVLQQYSERLVKKLEDKMLQLEEANRELRAREEALRLEHDNLTNILGAMEDGVYIVNQQYDIQYVNPVLMKDFGPFEGRKCYEYFHDGTDVCPWCQNQAVFAGETVRWEWYSSKNQRTYDLIDTPLRHPDGSMSKLEIFRDITERKQAEAELKKHRHHLEELVDERTRELRDAQDELVRQEKLALLGRLAASLAHELRHPLGVISNAAYFLQMTLTGADETTRDYLELVSSEVRGGEKTISDLLDYTRTKAPQKEDTLVSELATRLSEKKPPPKGVKVTTNIPRDVPAVLIDPQQIEQVPGNLVTNAYQAMPEGGNLTITAQAEKDQVYLSITDTGCGIAPDNMKRLFEPLFTTKARGIGLGLPVSKRLAQANGGDIEVVSEEGKGATFTVLLPVSRESAISPSA